MQKIKLDMKKLRQDVKTSRKFQELFKQIRKGLKPCVALLTLFVWCGVSSADTINIERLADAIYMAEGGAKTKHPYGILKKYKTTTPRQACINTIKTGLRKWDGQGSFVEFLSKTYAPVGAKNDPTGLNKNWVKNVSYYYER